MLASAGGGRNAPDATPYLLRDRGWRELLHCPQPTIWSVPAFWRVGLPKPGFEPLRVFNTQGNEHHEP